VGASWSINLRAVGIGAAIAVGASLGILVPAAIAAPANDLYENRAPLGSELPVRRVESNVGATRDGYTEVGTFAAGHSIWWEWESPLSEWTTVSTCDSEFATVVGVFEEGEHGYLNRLSAGNSAEGPGCWGRGSRYSFWAEAGHDYEIAADGFGFYPPGGTAPLAEGTITLSIEPTPPPPNDAFAAATPIGGAYSEPGHSPFEPPNDNRRLSTSLNGYNWGATLDPGEPLLAPGSGASVWYSWTPPESGTVTLSTCCQVTPELVTLYAGNSLTGLTPLAAGTTPEARPSAAVTGGAPYMIRVAGGPDAVAGRPRMGSFLLGLELVVPPKAGAPLAPGTTASSQPAPHGIAPPAVPTIAHRSVDTEARSATFRFGSATKGATYRCRLDAKPFRACSSPWKITGVKPGKHRLEVEAMAPGRPASAPAVAHFSVPAPHRRHHATG
jgi:hypothetical protein